MLQIKSQRTSKTKNWRWKNRDRIAARHINCSIQNDLVLQKMKSKELTLWVLSHWRSKIKLGPPAASSYFSHQHTKQQLSPQTYSIQHLKWNPPQLFGHCNSTANHTSRQSDPRHRRKSQRLSSASGSCYVNYIPSPRLHTSKTAFTAAEPLVNVIVKREWGQRKMMVMA